ncbi:CheA signal transduction histidine kinase [Verrucomicrobia bacterium]|nr:CheA signal transduction histidine kinase [Verrucomicrobiota bacterium]
MNPPSQTDLSYLSMLELFRVEAENQAAIMTNGLLELERSTGAPQTFETLMRAAHSLKGAARIVNVQLAVRLAHAMEDCFVAAQQGKVTLGQSQIDLLFRILDLLSQIARQTEASLADWENAHQAEIQQLSEELFRVLPAVTGAPAPSTSRVAVAALGQASPAEALAAGSSLRAPFEGWPAPNAHAIATRTPETPERVVRVTAENLNRLLGLAGESLVESRWLGPFAESLEQLKRQQAELAQKLEALGRTFTPKSSPASNAEQVRQLSKDLAVCQQCLSQRLVELSTFERRCAQLSERLYREMLRTRMRPFSEGVRRFPRMVRDLARALGKEVALEILGENTQVDRDILERLETPLAHLLRNAVDHGCETPAERQRFGKPAQGSLRVEARHSAGSLLVTVTDDGPGVSLDHVRKAIVNKGLATPVLAARLSEAELLEYLFLPGFSLKETVTEISGRGVGLDVVQNMVKSLRGTVRVSTQPGQGLRLQLQLPLTLSVLRALLVEVAGEPYALPLTQVARTLKLPYQEIQTVGGKPRFLFGGHLLRLLHAHQIFECPPTHDSGLDCSVVILGDRNARFGLVVDRFYEERELVVQPLDARLGKVPHISAAALLQDGSPVLIVDVEGLLRTVEKLMSDEGAEAALSIPSVPAGRRRKRVLVVDDSLTSRELARQLITSHGYFADVAVDGLDGWNAVRACPPDLVITDIEMPRMGGLELAALIKQDPKLKSVPVMIVSCRDGQEERRRGLDAGADYYLAKDSFDGETLWRAVVELIGEPGL